MGLLSNLMSKIFGHKAEIAPQPTSPSAPAPTAGSVPTAAPVTPAPLPEVDVTAILDDLAKKSDEKLSWKTSIVDLMKLVGMDSSLSSRKELARELNYPGDTSDSAAMNIWLHKEVIKRIAQNGGKVPADLLS